MADSCSITKGKEQVQVVAVEKEDVSEGVSPAVGLLFSFCSPEIIAAALRRLCPAMRIVFVSDGSDGLKPEDMEKLQSLEILLSHGNAIDKFQLVYSLPNLKWMHSFAAGVELITNAVQPDRPFPAYTLTRNASYFDLQMAEYVIGIILSRERFIPEMLEDSQNGRQREPNYRRIRDLSDISLGICGFGSIGKEVARVAKAFRIKVWALIRSFPAESSRCQTVDEYRSVDKLGELLSACDYVVSVLPGFKSTNGFFDGNVLRNCKEKKSVFINIGRGNVVSESSIIRALSERWIGHAVLDVFQQEPLPVESPLWTHPDVTITPHTSGSHVDEEKFLKTAVDNYYRYLNGVSLLHSVDWRKGY